MGSQSWILTRTPQISSRRIGAADRPSRVERGCPGEDNQAQEVYHNLPKQFKPVKLGAKVWVAPAATGTCITVRHIGQQGRRL
jgi:hypothetical protein